MAMTRASFEQALRKGAVGEQIVREWLEVKGFVVYQPLTDGAHAFDMMAIQNKKLVIALDVKAKAAMNKWPATGVDVNALRVYKEFMNRHNMPFFIAFVDERKREVYGNWISVLEKLRIVGGIKYPRVIENKYGKQIRLWPLEAMKLIAKLDEAKAQELRQLSQRNYQYAPEY